ncbi:hypothetical protein RBSWK_01024 [Rhodopirellula baltica SWK14]|uniref:Uncharacterized protein n=1 Tax=Rhodopirellula baltica SWK14 TaxID=993516 RepID=L7CL87_RHOBT|nr:hypothetical protein RBSWK_01024 [Rhodopirellula baltica SWK14]
MARSTLIDTAARRGKSVQDCETLPLSGRMNWLSLQDDLHIFCRHCTLS